MFMLTFVFKNSPQLITLHYNKFDDARKNMGANATPPAMPITDDYGGSAAIVWEQITAVYITDLEQELKARAIQENAKNKMIIDVQRKAQQMAQAAPQIVPVNSGMRQ